MKKMFKDIMNVDGQLERFPLAEDGVVFFSTKEGTFHLYALYTKRDFSDSKIINLTYDTYEEEIAAYKIRHNKEPVIIYLPSSDAVTGLTSFVRYKSTVDNMSMEDLYNLSYKGE